MSAKRRSVTIRKKSDLRATELKPREKKVLYYTIHSYIQDGEPVGSRTIAKAFDYEMSPATVRNICSDLEDWGLLEQPHTSAGRQPSDVGYRYYIDELMKIQELTSRQRAQIEKKYFQDVHELDDVLEKTARLLGAVSGRTAVVVYPDLSEAEIRYLTLVPLDSYRSLLVLVTRSGAVQNKVIQFEDAVTAESLQRISNALNQRLAGERISDFQGCLESVVEKIKAELGAESQAIQTIVEFGINDALKSNGRVNIVGRTQMIQTSDFKNMSKLQDAMNVLDDEKELAQLLGSTGDNTTEVKLGNELPETALDELGVIRSSYCVRDRVIGSFGLIGPKRMPYGRLLGLMNATSHMMNGAFKRILGRKI